MYVKKGWVALPVVFIFGLLLTIGCNEKFNAQKPDISKIDTTAETVKQKEEKTAKRDTVQIGGYNIVAEPNEYVTEIKLHRRYGKMHDSFIIEFNANGNKLSEVEKLQVVKDMFNLNEQVFSYKRGEDRWQMLYKGIEVDRFAIKISGNKATGSIYPEMDVDITVNITEQEAFEVAKADFSDGNKHIAFYFEYPDIPSWKEGKRIPEEEQKLPKGELKIYYHQPHNKFYFGYKFILSAFSDEMKYYIDPKTKDIQLKHSNSFQAFPKCYECDVNSSTEIISSNCSMALTNYNVSPSDYQLLTKANVPLPSYQNYRNECLVIDGNIDDNEGVFFLYDSNRNIIVADKQTSTNNKPISIDGISTSGFNDFIEFQKFDQVVTQGFDVMKGFQEAYDYYLDELNITGYDNNSATQLIAFVNKMNFGPPMTGSNNAQWFPENAFWEFGAGDLTMYTTIVGPKTIYHEYTHAVLYKYIGLQQPTPISETRALHEAICDIMSVIIYYKIFNNNNWITGEKKHYNGSSNDFDEYKLHRDFQNPAKSIPEGATKFKDTNSNWNNSTDPQDIEAPYTNMQIFNYWFYLITQGSTDPVNGVDIGDGLGIEKTEELILLILEAVKAEIEVESGLSDMNYIEFRDVVLNAVADEYTIPNNPLNVCSDEYSKVYRAFQAVGLIDNSNSDPDLNFTPPCHVFGYESPNEIECPSDQNFNFEPTPEGYVFETRLDGFNFPSGNYLISVLTDSNLDGIFELVSEVYTVEPLDVNGIQLSESVDNADVLIKIIVKQLPSVDAPPTDDTSSLTYVYFTFSISMQCNLIGSDSGSAPTGPESNTGPISLNVNQNILTCNDREICIDYDVTGPDYMYVSISDPEDFFHIISQAGNNAIGQFCWYPDINDVGTHSFNITATDGHPTEPITQTTAVTVSVSDYTNDVWANTSPVAVKTNETSAGANNGSVTIGLGSTYTLEYRWVGLGPNGDDLVTYSNWPNGHTQTGLSDGTYTIDIYIQGTDCLYGTYTATVGTNSSGGGTHGCAFDQNLIHMRAMPTVFNDQTTIEIELQEQPLQVNLSAQNVFGTASQSLVNGQVLGVGTHQVTFDGSADPNGLYIFQLALVVPQCRSAVPETISIKGFKY